MELFFAILFSGFIFVLFKLFPKFNIDTFQAIVVNYFVAFICGLLFFPFQLNALLEVDASWFGFTLSAATLFIGLFLIMGMSAQRNGLSSTSVAVKMSMALSVLGMVIFYAEAVNAWKISGITLAIFGVIGMTLQANEQKNERSSGWMLLVLFLSSGMLDFLLNYIQHHVLTENETAFFTAYAFGLAGIIGVFIALILIAKRKLTLAFRHIIAGVLLGIPNYFSIYFLMKAYDTLEWSNSSILAVINVCIVVIASLVGLLFFKEKWNRMKIIGFISSLISILFLYLSV
ncbi:MAG: EamA family transporter [Crocinitomicaceae bacterium]